MIIRAPHWLAAFAASAAVHFVAANMLGENEDVVAMERSAGTVTVMRGSLFDSIDAERAQESADLSQTVEPVETVEQARIVQPVVDQPAQERAAVAGILPVAAAEVVPAEKAVTAMAADLVPQAQVASSTLEARNITGIMTGSVAVEQTASPAEELSAAAIAQDAPATEPTDAAADSRSETESVADAAPVGMVEPVKVEATAAKAASLEAVAPTETASPAATDAERVAALPELPLPTPNPLTRQERERRTASLQPPRQAPKKQKASNKAAGQDRKTLQDRDSAASRKGSAESRTASVDRNAGDCGRGDGGGRSDLKNYYGELFSRIRRAKRRPASSSRTSGLAIVRFTVFATGRISAPVVIRSSGHASFDDAARAAVSRAAPFPPIPASAGKSKLVLRVEMKF